MEQAENRQMSETFRLGALLALVGGFLDAYTYLARGGVFCNAQTGNTVLLGIHLIRRDWLGALHYLVPILAFAAGVLTARAVHDRFGASARLHWRQLTVGAEMLLLAVVAFLPAAASGGANVLVSYVCAVQAESFRKVHGSAFATTMCTGNLRQMGEHILAFAVDKRPGALRGVFKYVAIIVSFVMGAVIGTFFVAEMQEEAIWICCYTLFFVLSYLLVMEDG